MTRAGVATLHALASVATVELHRLTPRSEKRGYRQAAAVKPIIDNAGIHQLPMSPVDLDQQRAACARQLAADLLDVLVIGGGIVGAGAARDAALRRLKTGLVEQHDLAFGTSSRSTRLLHGGLRYLAQGRVGLVWEASHEKCLLHRLAPHLAAPLPFVFPAWKGSAWPGWKLRVGVRLYDLLCGWRNLGPSRWLAADQLCAYVPGIKSQGLRGGVEFYDGQTNDARLVIDTLRSAAVAGAIVCNYLRFEAAQRDNDRWRCRLRDRLCGTCLEVFARTIVNATGPWAESLPQNSILLRLTKGVHLVVDRARLPLPAALIVPEGKRILFAIPWGERVILGTTDTDFQGRIEHVRTEEADVEYVLRAINCALPEARLTADDVIRTWAGLRPLISSRSRGSPDTGPSDISRAHRISMPQPGWFDVAGGKLTTFRRMGEQVVDRVVGFLGVRMRPSRTAEEPLLPPAGHVSASGILPPPVEERLVKYYCEHEWAVHLDDVMRRRTSWHYYRTDALQVARLVAGWMAHTFGWSDQQKAAELSAYAEQPD